VRHCPPGQPGPDVDGDQARERSLSRSSLPGWGLSSWSSRLLLCHYDIVVLQYCSRFTAQPSAYPKLVPHPWNPALAASDCYGQESGQVDSAECRSRHRINRLSSFLTGFQIQRSLLRARGRPGEQGETGQAPEKGAYWGSTRGSQLGPGPSVGEGSNLRLDGVLRVRAGVREVPLRAIAPGATTSPLCLGRPDESSSARVRGGQPGARDAGPRLLP